MTRIVLKFGLVAGAIVGSMVAAMPFTMQGPDAFEHGELVGYTTMVLAFLMVFFGVRSYRDTVAGGVLTFGKGVQVGLWITLVTCAVYVATWEVVYHAFMPDFLDRYAAHQLAELKARGASPEALARATREMDEFKRLYANPLVNVGMTFLEIFPVGLVMTLVSAGILRRKPESRPAEPALA